MSDASKLAFLEAARKPFKPTHKAVAAPIIKESESLTDLERRLVALIVEYLEDA